MSMSARGVTALLAAWSEGDSEALREMMPLVYDELHQLARRYFEREAEGHTLQPTALIHEVYLRLAAEKHVDWDSRAHFFGAVSRLMRRILVDHARERKAGKRGYGQRPLPLVDIGISPALSEEDLIALDDALTRLAKMDPRQGRIVELRFFAGLTIRETAEVLGVGTATVNREWRTARAWIYHEINGERGD